MFRALSAHHQESQIVLILHLVYFPLEVNEKSKITKMCVEKTWFKEW